MKTSNRAVIHLGVYAHSFENINFMRLSVEVSFVTIAPEFRRSHVHTHATYLLISYSLNSREAAGLGYVRVAWIANSASLLSHNAAVRLGMTYERTTR